MAQARISRITKSGEILRPGLRGNLVCLFDAGNSSGQIVVVGQSSLDEFRQGLVVEDFLPRQVGKGGLLSRFGRASENSWRGYVRALVVRTDCATRQK